jgi:uncharacterized protein YndB with AHSA1/START domain
MSEGPSTGATAVHLTRRFDAPRDLVFGAWTDPEAAKQWWRTPDASITSVEMDVRVGGEYRIAYEQEGVVAQLVGTYLDVEPVERLVFTWRWSPPLLEQMDTGETRVTVEFRDLGGKTEVVLLHEQLRNEEVRAFHDSGWNRVLDQLAEALV